AVRGSDCAIPARFVSPLSVASSPAPMIRKIALGAATGAMLILACTPVAAQTLRGSPASVDLMHRQALRQGLRFHPTASSIRSARDGGELVRLDGNSDYTLAAVSYPYVLPETHTFVLRLASQYRS